MWGPIPLPDLPYVVPEIGEEVEFLRKTLGDVVRTRHELLEQLQYCNTFEDMKDVIRTIYAEASSQEVLDGLERIAATPSRPPRPPGSNSASDSKVPSAE